MSIHMKAYEILSSIGKIDQYIKGTRVKSSAHSYCKPLQAIQYQIASQLQVDYVQRLYRKPHTHWDNSLLTNCLVKKISRWYA